MVDESFGDLRHEVNGAIAEVGDFFGMIERPCGAESGCGRRGVAGIGAGGGVTLTDGDGHGAKVDGSGETAVALTLKFSVPAGSGKPDFNFDIGIGGGSGVHGDSAKCGERFEEGVGCCGLSGATGRRHC